LETSKLRNKIFVGTIVVSLVLLHSMGCSFSAWVTPETIQFPTLQDPHVTPSGPPEEPTRIPSPTPEVGSTGKIAYTCQLSGVRFLDHICIINADGTGFKKLTPDDGAAHFYPSIAPDGMSVVYSANPTGVYEIYEADLNGNTHQVTHGLGTLTSPEISPDGKLIAFSLGDGQTSSIWIVNRDGSQPRVVYGPGWDPTWSPDGEKILFASYDQNNTIQLFFVDLDGSNLQQVTQLENLRGRSDWSPDGNWAVTYAGEPWGRELFSFQIGGGEPVQLTPSGGNSQGPSISPDGRWVAFTAYYGDIGNDDGCEIYIIRTDGTQLTRLTENDYCDWQPRWGQ
jgi:TolB protein